MAACQACGAEPREGQRFCGECGSALGGNRVDAVSPLRAGCSPATGRRPQRAERKQASVLFVDVEGSMRISESFDTEQWWRIMDEFYDLLKDGVSRFHGEVLRFTGDGIKAVFGVPDAREDHAGCAARAALHLRGEIAHFARRLDAEHALGFAVRMGINSGEVIVGTLGSDLGLEYAAVGRTAGLAQRMERLARSGTIYASRATASLIRRDFQLVEVGELPVAGSSARERVFEVIALSGGVGQPGASPFVGRRREIGALERALARAKEGDGHAVVLVGEPGVGKTRLVHELTQRCAGVGVEVHRAGGTAHGRDAPLLGALELWRAMLGVSAGDDPAAARKSIERRLLALDSSLQAELSLVHDFVGVAHPERPAPRLAAEGRTRALLSAMRRIVRAMSSVSTTLVVVEDLHLIDEASAVYFSELVTAAAGTRTLVLFTSRPGEGPDSLREPGVEHVRLTPLSSRASARLIESLLGDHPSVEQLVATIARRAGGNPFFCEELVSALSESARLHGERGRYELLVDADDLALPATIHATLAARVDHLPRAAKELLNVAAVAGYEVSEPLLHEVSDLPAAEVAQAIAALIAAELLGERRGAAGVEYVFNHPLTQEVAYRSQLREHRERAHVRIAHAIEALYPGRIDELAAISGWHFDAGGDPLSAARQYARAATWVGLSDISNALALWRRVGDLAANLPDSAETAWLSILSHVRQLDFGWRLGISEQQADAHYLAGRDLALRNGDRVGLLGITDVYAHAVGLAGHPERYAELAEQGHRLSVEIGDPGLRIAAAVVTIHARMVLGRQADALALADEMIALAAPNPTLGRGLGVECPLAMCQMLRGSILTHTARFDDAYRALEQSLQLSRDHGDLENEGFTHGAFVVLARYTGRTDGVLAHATTGYEIAERVGSAFSRAIAIGYLGCAHRMLGQADQAIGALERALAIAREARTGLENEANWLAWLSDALRDAGHEHRAVEVAGDAVALALRSGSRTLLPCCYRALAESLAASPDRDVLGAAQALGRATAAVDASSVFAERPLIERARAGLAALAV